MNTKLSFSDKQEITRFITEKHVNILNLCHIPEDGRLKTLSFSAADGNKVQEILECGERVDGSSLFSFIEADRSDIYVMPRLDGAFVSPFALLPTLNLLCDYLDENGKPLDIAPKNVLKRAEEKLLSSSGVELRALAELEFYMMAKMQSDVLFPNAPDRNYHESAPFVRFEDIRSEILAVLANIGIATKYGHSEVGRIMTKDGVLMEQHEVEFAPQRLSDMAETIAVAKWVVRNVCQRHGVSASFSPKIALEHAGNGMHLHLCVLKDGRNVVANADGNLSGTALKIIGGVLRFALSLTAFGNPTPASYVRFLARKESPMHVCWSARNRLALVRIPLWWSFRQRSQDANGCRETIEYRAPDAFADVHLLLAGVTLAANYGLLNAEESLKLAEALHIDVADKTRKQLKALPRSCYEAAEHLREDRGFFEADGVFPKILIDRAIEKLVAFRDKDLWKSVEEKPGKIESTLQQYLHYG